MKDSNHLRNALAELKKERPRLRSREAAQHLGISECELIALSAGEHVTILEGNWKSLLKKMNGLGRVMALTRNEYCVHERKGVYENVQFMEGPANMGVAVNPDIDLRFFMNEWTYGLAITMERGTHPTLYGFQFYNAQGTAIHKIYTTPDSNLDVYHQLVADYKAELQQPILGLPVPPPPCSTSQLDESIDVSGFQNAWRGLQDTHDFYGMLKDFGVSRTQGLRLAPEGMTICMENDTVVRLLEKAATQKVPIMCFVHSPGCIQIHTGPVERLHRMGAWYNIMDPDFNLHLHTEGISETWIVKKPTKDGIVTSIELFDAQGELIVYFFGARKPGKPELPEWRAIVEELLLQRA